MFLGEGRKCCQNIVFFNNPLNAIGANMHQVPILTRIYGTERVVNTGRCIFLFGGAGALTSYNYVIEIEVLFCKVLF